MADFSTSATRTPLRAALMAAQHPAMVRRLVLASCPFSQDGFYPEMLPQQAAVSAAMAEQMKETPMYKSYVAIAPHPEDFPKLLDKMGAYMRKSYDWSADVKKLTMPVMLIYGDSDMFRPEHEVKFYQLLGGGLKDAGWNRESMPRNRLAILPDLTRLFPSIMNIFQGNPQFAIDLARAWFFPAGIVPKVKMSDFAPCHVDIRDQVSFGDLLMIQVVDDLAGRAVDRLADLVGLRDLLQEQARMVGPPVQRLDDDDHAGRLGDLDAAAQIVDQVGRLVVRLQPLADAARRDQRPLGVGALAGLDGFLRRVNDHVADFLVLLRTLGFRQVEKRTGSTGRPAHWSQDTGECVVDADQIIAELARLTPEELQAEGLCALLRTLCPPSRVEYAYVC